MSTFLYTIPSLALFELLVAPVGANVYAAEIALVSYTLLILFRNILTGLRGVPAEVLDAAEGMGMTRTQVLRRVELPLALPAIVAGLRIAVVTIIALATIVYTIYDAGLGVPIHTALGEGPFKTELIAAGGADDPARRPGRRPARAHPTRAHAVGARAGQRRVGPRCTNSSRRSASSCTTARCRASPACRASRI